jgi:hypothetical protein
MTGRRSARCCMLAVAMSIASLARAGVWGSQPVIGVSVDYSTNPGLLVNLPHTAETHAALLVDAPTTYNGNAFKVGISPSFRFSDSPGYSSLDSDYEHLTARGEFDTELSVFKATALAARDSSLFHDFLLNGSTGVERQTTTADLNWDRHLTERFEFVTDVNATRVRYGAPVGSSVTLTDYKYASVTPTIVWDESERSQLTLSAGAGRYNSLDGLTESTNANLQLGFVKHLSELWSLNASAGYSRAVNKLSVLEQGVEQTDSGLILVLIPVKLQSTQTGTVYAASLGRQTPVWAFTATASRQLVPSGFAFLSRQETYELSALYNESERLSFNGDVRRVTYQQPTNSSVADNVDVTSVQLGAAWRWTENWTVTLTGSYLLEHYGAPSIGISAGAVSLELSRRFNWKSLQ